MSITCFLIIFHHCLFHSLPANTHHPHGQAANFSEAFVISRRLLSKRPSFRAFRLNRTWSLSLLLFVSIRTHRTTHRRAIHSMRHHNRRPFRRVSQKIVHLVFVTFLDTWLWRFHSPSTTWSDNETTNNEITSFVCYYQLLPRFMLLIVSSLTSSMKL